MIENLLKFIVCPKCKGSFSLKNASYKGEHIWEGSLLCTNCKSTFLIKNGVPRLLVDSNINYSTANKYGYLFSAWSKGEFIKDELYGHSVEEELSDFFVAFDINPSDLMNKIILDAGCGAGRLTKNLGQFKGEVIGIDIHDAMAIPFQQSFMLENVHIIQADLFHLPFSKNFDFLWCEGVLPYVYDPKEGFHRLAGMVKKGGRMYVLFYRKGLGKTLVYIRRIFKKAHKLSPNILYAFCNFLSLSYLLSASIIRRENRLKDYSCLSFSFYDRLLQEHVHYHTIDEVKEWFKEEGFEVLKVLEYRTGIMGIKKEDSE